MPSNVRLGRRTMARAIVIAALGSSSGFAPHTHANELHLGHRAPIATLTTLDGRRISTQDLLGRVVILTFWATWCEPCRAELPLLSDYAEEHQKQGLVVLGFALDDQAKRAEVERIASTLHFPIGLMDPADARGYGRIWRLPVNFTLDRSGSLVDDGWKAKPPQWTRARLEQIVTPLLR